MDPNTFPTKGNLILAKNALALSKQGFDLMDKKRNILIRELMELISEASDIQNQIDETFSNAYQALQKANIQMGIHQVEQIAKAVPVENSIRIKRRSVMGTEIPKANSLPSLGVDSYLPKFCSFNRISILHGMPAVSDICFAVSAALISGEYNISSICIFPILIRSPNSIACLCPSSVSAMSVAPHILFSTFHIVCPCLVK